jgi:hypothetical protein
MRQLPFALGMVLAGATLLALAEGFLRLFPPSDLRPFLGEDAGLRGLFKPDAEFAVTYRSFQAFAAANARALKRYPPLGRPADHPLWAMFGNSFVHAPGMLADTARRRVPERIIFNLGRNEHLCVRCAQVKLLLEHGLKPERIFFALMPVDMPVQQPLDSLRVTSQGAMTYQPRLPPAPWDGLVRTSRLALTAWCRCGLHQAHPGFDRGSLHEGLPETLTADIRRLLAGLGRIARRHRVPLTILLIPAFDQVCKGASFGFQEALAAEAHRQGLDVCDVRDGFLKYPDKAALFLPDKHFSPAGNEVLLDELLRHLRMRGA